MVCNFRVSARIVAVLLMTAPLLALLLRWQAQRVHGASCCSLRHRGELDPHMCNGRGEEILTIVWAVSWTLGTGS